MKGVERHVVGRVPGKRNSYGLHVHKKMMVNLATLSHPIAMISDQISSVRLALSRIGFPVQTSNECRDDSLNIVPEGFTRFAALYISEYCAMKRKKIAVLMTEHIDLERRVLINDVPVGDPNEYLPNGYDRLANLLYVLPHVRFFLIVGHLPDPEKLTRVFRAIPIIKVPYMPIEGASVPSFSGRRFELCFTGSLTNHREAVMEALDRHFKCVCMFADNPEVRRMTIANSHFNLQIPQNTSWRHISPMRVIFALRAGTATLNVTTFPEPIFDRIARRISPADCVPEIAHVLELGGAEVLSKSISAYNDLALDSIARSALPIALSIWSDLEQRTV